MKKVLTIVLVIAMLVAMAVPAMAKNAPVEKLTWTDGFGFHCNAAKGNGATDVINLINGKVVAKGSQKDVFGVKNNPITLLHASGTAYNLATNDIECATCGRIDWVTYSNNNGVINGKNIQANHSGSPRYWAQAYAKLVLVDIVKDCKDEVVSKDLEIVNKSGKYTTDEKAVFNFTIPEGFNIIEGNNPIIVEFEAIRGQNIDGGKVVALRITVLPCNCPPEGPDDPDDPEDPPFEFFGCGAYLCDNCKESNGNSHNECWDNPFASKHNFNKRTNYACGCGECGPGIVSGPWDHNNPDRPICSCSCKFGEW